MTLSPRGPRTSSPSQRVISEQSQPPPEAQTRSKSVAVSPCVNSMTYQDLSGHNKDLSGPTKGRHQPKKPSFDDLPTEVQEQLDSAITNAIQRSVDYDDDQHYDPIFDLSRRLIPIIGESPPVALLRDVAARFAAACEDCPMVGAELVYELQRKMGSVRRPKRCLIDLAYAARWEQALPDDVIELGDPRITALSGFIVALQKLRGDEMVVLAQVPVAKQFGMSQPTLSRLLAMLMKLGFLVRLKSADHGNAAEYRWVA